jgi:adenylyltransferase/sulfurtransferase
MIKEITARQLAMRQENGESFYLLDVRQPEEHALAALPNSTLIPLGQLPARAEEVKPPEGVPIVVYCHHGVRSQHGAAALLRLGHRDVYSLAGGIDAWSVEVDPAVPRY